MKFLKYVLIALLVTVVLGTITYFAGPKVSFEQVNPELPKISASIDELDDYIEQKEADFENIKRENQSRIVWADTVRQTDYVLVYLHGFSAGPMEGAPLHTEVARRYGMNLYLPRLSRHGLDDVNAFNDLTPAGLMNTAKEALAIGRKLGREVILMSCSTGGTLGIYLTAHHSDIKAHIMYSPNIEIYDPTAKFMTGPWGEAIVRQVVGEYREPEKDEEDSDSVRLLKDRYWYDKYSVKGLVALQGLLDMTMKEEIFEMVKQPYFLGYYYKNDTAQDMTVSVEAMKQFDKQTQTPEELKRLVAFPEAGEHVINSSLTSDSYAEVRQATYSYMEDVLGLEPVN